MTNPGLSHNQEPQDPEVRLAQAKEAFRATVLTSDPFFAVINAKLGTKIDRSDTPHFGCEPTLGYDEEGRATIGLRLSSSSSDEEAGITVKFAMFDYLPIATENPDTGLYDPDPSLVDLLVSTGVADVNGALMEIGNTWNQAKQELLTGFGEGELVIHPRSDTITLLSVLERTFYIPDEE